MLHGFAFFFKSGTDSTVSRSGRSQGIAGIQQRCTSTRGLEDNRHILLRLGYDIWIPRNGDLSRM